MYIWINSVWTEIWCSQLFKKVIIGNIICTSLQQTTCFMKWFCTYFAQNIHFRKRKKSIVYKLFRTTIFRSTSQKTFCIFMPFGWNKIASKCFSKMMYVAWGIISLVHYSKNSQIKNCPDSWLSGIRNIQDWRML